MELLHLIALILTAPFILYADHLGFQYFTGKQPLLDAKKVMRTHKIVFAGLILLVITGFTLAVPRWSFLINEPFFYAKMAFVATLAYNGFFIGRLMQKSSVVPFAQLTKEEKRVLLTSGAISGVSWVATILIAFFGL